MAAADQLIAEWAKMVEPPKEMTVSEWADAYRYLSPEASAEPGKWRTSRAEYQRGIMDAFSDPQVHTVVVMSSAQVGKTELLLSIIGYYIHQDPSPILVLQPTLEMAQTFSKDRLAKMLRDTPVLRGKVKDPRSRDSGNTTLHKALALDTPIPTPDGWTTVGEIKVGDVVFDEKGRRCNVIDLTPIYRNRKCYKMVFSDGEEIVADAGHLWTVDRFVVKKKPRPRQTRITETLTTETIFKTFRKGVRSRYSIPMHGPIETPHRELPIDPYVLGLWLGDGLSHRTRIVMWDADANEIYQYVKEAFPDARLKSCAGTNTSFIDFGITVNWFRDELSGRIVNGDSEVRAAFRSESLLSKAGDGSSQKHIPVDYLRASIDQRKELLRGLMDSDGSIRRDQWCIFVNKNKRVIDGVCELVSSLGIKWSLEYRKGTECYAVGFSAPDFPVFKLKRKLARQKRARGVKAGRRYVVDVVEVDSVPVRCITVDSESHLFLAGRRMVPTHNSFPGGHITIVGANSPSGLASRPIRVVLADEVDRYPESAGTEGDPVQLAFKRTTTFWNRKHAMVSTPTIKGASRIEMAFEQSDKRYFLVPCPDCGEFQRLKWAQVKWTDDDPTTARYCCEHCGALWDDVQRHRAVRKGRWEATAPFNGIAGFHISELYSPWRKLEETVRDFLAAKDDYEMLKAFINTSLGETFEVQGEGADSHELMRRLEDYRGVPDGVHTLTAGVDVQDDRIEMEVVGWGADEESWSIAYHRVFGSPDDPQTWDDVAHLLSADYDGHRILAACIDSGGHFTQHVYRFCKDHQARRWWPVKGANTTTAPPIGRPSTSNRLRVPLFTVGVSAIKETIYFRLKRDEPGPGYMHFSRHVNDEEYFRQLTAEQLVTKWRRGVPERRWVKTRERNEALDCRVYAYAALLIANPRGVAPRVQKQVKQPPKKQGQERKRGGWAYGWR